MQIVFKVIILLFFCLPSLSLDLEEYLKNLTFVHVQRVLDRSENEIEINAELQMRKYLLSGKRVSQISVDNKEKILEYGARRLTENEFKQVMMGEKRIGGTGYIHVTWGAVVFPHGPASWDFENLAFITPAMTQKGRIYKFHPEDTSLLDYLQLDGNSFIVTKDPKISVNYDFVDLINRTDNSIEKFKIHSAGVDPKVVYCSASIRKPNLLPEKYKNRSYEAKHQLYNDLLNCFVNPLPSSLSENEPFLNIWFFDSEKDGESLRSAVDSCLSNNFNLSARVAEFNSHPLTWKFQDTVSDFKEFFPLFAIRNLIPKAKFLKNIENTIENCLQYSLFNLIERMFTNRNENSLREIVCSSQNKKYSENVSLITIFSDAISQIKSQHRELGMAVEELLNFWTDCQQYCNSADGWVERYEKIKPLLKILLENKNLLQDVLIKSHRELAEQVFDIKGYNEYKEFILTHPGFYHYLTAIGVYAAGAYTLYVDEWRKAFAFNDPAQLEKFPIFLDSKILLLVDGPNNRVIAAEVFENLFREYVLENPFVFDYRHWFFNLTKAVLPDIFQIFLYHGKNAFQNPSLKNVLGYSQVNDEIDPAPRNFIFVRDQMRLLLERENFDNSSVLSQLLELSPMVKENLKSFWTILQNYWYVRYAIFHYKGSKEFSSVKEFDNALSACNEAAFDLLLRFHLTHAQLKDKIDQELR